MQDRSGGAFELPGLKELKFNLPKTVRQAYATMRGPLSSKRGPLYEYHDEHRDEQHNLRDDFHHDWLHDQDGDSIGDFPDPEELPTYLRPGTDVIAMDSEESSSDASSFMSQLYPTRRFPPASHKMRDGSPVSPTALKTRLSSVVPKDRIFSFALDEEKSQKSRDSHISQVSNDSKSSGGSQISTGAFGNYGYVKVNGKWVDPDSEYHLYQAWKGSREPSPPHVPGLRRLAPEMDGDPRPLTPVRLAKEYEDFCEYVSDDEGDPRAMQITPATFAKWAKGVKKGDWAWKKKQFVKKVFRLEKPRPERLLHQRRHTLPMTLNIISKQFDVVTGEAISPYYEVDEFPLPTWDPLGLDHQARPASFQRSYPRESKRLDRILIGLEDKEELLRHDDDPARVEIFSNDKLISALADDTSDPNSGLATFSKISMHLNFLRGEHERLKYEVQGGLGVQNALFKQVEHLEKEVCLLKARYDAMLAARRAQAEAEKRARQAEAEAAALFSSPNAGLKEGDSKDPELDHAARAAKEADEEARAAATARIGSYDRHLEHVSSHVDSLEHSCAQSNMMLHGLIEVSDRLRERAGGLIVAREEMMRELGVSSVVEACLLKPGLPEEEERVDW